MTASELITKQITDTGGWRGNILATLRKVILAADPDITEEWKWETGVWSHEGMVCATSPFKDHVKINFFKGALLADPHHLINSGLESKSHRSINFSETDILNESALTDLIRAAVALNVKKK